MNEISKDNLPAKSQLDDIFADADEDKSYNTVPVASNNQPSAKPEIMQYDNSGDTMAKIKKYLIIFVVLILIAIVSGATYYWRQEIFAKANGYLNMFAQKDKPSKVVEPVQNQEVNKTESKTKLPKIDTTVIAPAVKDTDRDGLVDDEEKKIGTNLNKADTDGDGLYDGEEVKIYKTDPLNSDTNNNGIKDGEEVKMKLNPRGAGKLDEMK